MKLNYLHEFDRYDMASTSPVAILTVNREVQVPTFGYPTEDAYYRDASSTDSLLAVRIPLLAVNAQDDPVGFCYQE
jgi:predicted alpha/beta-fold hydrolase